jgi:hypothetical protein
LTLLEKLQSHKGGLLRIKSDLFWYSGRGNDNITGRICLLLDAVAADDCLAVAAATFTAAWGAGAWPAAHLLIDGSTRWVWVAEKDVELIVETR